MPHLAVLDWIGLALIGSVMAPLIRYFGYLTLLAYGRAPAPPLRLVHARLSEYRKERDVGKRLSTQKGRAHIFHN